MQIDICVPPQLLQIILHTILNPTEVFLKRIANLDLELLGDTERLAVKNAVASVDIRRKSREPTRLIYESAIALKIAPSLGISPITIAALLAEMVSAYTFNSVQDCVDPRLPVPILAALKVYVIQSGYLQFEFSDVAIAVWLEQLVSQSLPAAATVDSPSDRRQFVAQDPYSIEQDRRSHSPILAIDSKLVFQLQHAHARCCSILRHAHAVQWLTFAAIDLSPQQWQLVSPMAIPWLTADQHLQTSHSAERMLIDQLFVVLDQLDPSSDRGSEAEPLPLLHARSQPQLIQMTAKLAAAFQTLHREIPVGTFAAPSRSPQQAATKRNRLQANLGLIWATQRILNWLLQEKVGITAPAEL